MDPIKYIFEKPALTWRISRWNMLLSKYDIEYRSQNMIKGSVLADHLAHQPIEDYQSMQYDFPDEEILYLEMKDCAIYYLSKKFTDCETRYSMLEKTCCALAWDAKRLRQ